MRGAIQNLEGIDSVFVSFQEGRADIKLKDGNTVTLQQVQQSIQECGFKSEEVDIRIKGKVIQRKGKLFLEVEDLKIIYLVVDHPDAKGKAAELLKLALNKQAIVYGFVPIKEKKKKESLEPDILQLRDYTFEPN